MNPGCGIGLFVQKLMEKVQMFLLKILGCYSIGLFKGLCKAGMIFIPYLMKYLSWFPLMLLQQILRQLQSFLQDPFAWGTAKYFCESSLESR